MYVNERDQINYHGFLRALREMNQVSQECVGKGICTTSGMNRFENGNRVAEKLMRDRLTSRLGVSGEKYEDYLQPKEYERWEHRLRIVKAIQKKDLQTAKRELESYEKLDMLNNLNIQFVETMRYQILTLEDAPQDIRLQCIKKAVAYTIPSVNKALEGAHLLADQEINLLTELVRLLPPSKVVRDVKAWRIARYEKLISYMEQSHWEKLQKAKVYPKIAYDICEYLLEDEMSEMEIRRGLELCHNAIELLRDTSRLYYFIELTETRRALAERLIERGIDSDEEKQLREMLEENNCWEKVFKELYAEYQVAPYMSDFCYLYYETECHNMVEVIESRRKMLGLSRVKLGDGICTDRTIIRFEREGKSPTIDLVRLLFEKMGMCAEYRRARVVTNDVEALFLSNEVTKNMNGHDFEMWKCSLNLLKDKLYLDIPYNKQEVKRSTIWLELLTNTISREEFHDQALKALECTLPISALYKKGDKYLTRSETTCIYDLAFVHKDELSNLCLKYLLGKYGNIKDEQEIEVSEICVYELVTDELANYLGNIGENEKSQNISKKMLKECLRYRRSEVLVDNIYNVLWNQNEISKIHVVSNNKIELQKCFYISQMLRQYKRMTFFQEKLDRNN